MSRVLCALTLLTLLAPAVSAVPLAPKPAEDPKPLVLIDSKIIEPDDDHVLASPRFLTLSDHEVTVIVGDEQQKLVHLNLRPVVRTKRLLSVRVSQGDNDRGRLILFEPNKTVTVVLPGDKRRLLDLTAKVLPDKVTDLL